MIPVIPHFANECLEMLKNYKGEKEMLWPEIDKKILIKDKVNFVIQINVKTRAVLYLKTGLSENMLLEKINNDEKIKNYIKNKEIKKKIFIPDRLINIII